MSHHNLYKRGGVKTNTAEKYIATLVFKNRIYQYEGQQFEDFFVEIMQNHQKYHYWNHQQAKKQKI